MKDEALIGHADPGTGSTMLIIGGDAAVNEEIIRFFQTMYRIVHAQDGLSGLVEAIRWVPDVIVLHSRYARVESAELCKRIREVTRGVLLVLTDERMGGEQRIACFEAGADDVLHNQASPRELFLRVQVLLRRVSSEYSQEGPSVMHFGPLRMDSSNYRAHVYENELMLTRKEFAILWTMAAKNGQVVSRSELMKRVWKYEAASDDRMIDTHLNRLRKKLMPHARYLRIKTAWGIGYKLESIE